MLISIFALFIAILSFLISASKFYSEFYQRRVLHRREILDFVANYNIKVRRYSGEELIKNLSAQDCFFEKIKENSIMSQFLFSDEIKKFEEEIYKILQRFHLLLGRSTFCNHEDPLLSRPCLTKDEEEEYLALENRLCILVRSEIDQKYGKYLQPTCFFKFCRLYLL